MDQLPLHSTLVRRWVPGAKSTLVAIPARMRHLHRFQYDSVSERVARFPRFTTSGGRARFDEQHDIPGLLGSSPSPSGHLLRRDDTRVGSQGKSTEGAAGADICQSGTKGGTLLGWERRGLPPFEVTRQRRFLCSCRRENIRRGNQVCLCRLPVYCYRLSTG